jgi:muramoyltetrapeptide carboxypeptidase LdcA involved in peptidoglycan recycling
MIKARRLRAGDTVAAVSLSWGGPGAIPHRYQAGKRQLMEVFGVRVLETPHALREPAWLRRNPQARADDLMGAFADPAIHGIISTIGGEESIRLVPFLDAAVIRANPKVFVGYSDTTVTHLACFSAGLCTFYGPAIMAGFAENAGMHPYMTDAVRRTMFTTEPPGLITPNRDGWTVEHLEWKDPENQTRPRSLQTARPWRFISGHAPATGHLIGGCLEVLAWLRGTPVWPKADAFDGAILFIETSEEGVPPLYVARELRTLAAMGILQRLSGLIVGRPGGNVPIEKFGAYDDAVLEVVHDEAELRELAVVTQMDFGHTDPIFVLPYGVTARIDPAAQTFAILEAGVVG